MQARKGKRAMKMDVGRGVDIIGDVHGCYEEFVALIERLGYRQDGKDGLFRHPEGRKLLSLGDITSRGPHSILMLQFFLRHLEAGIAEMVDSNHGWKIARWLDGRRVTLAHGDEKVEAEFERYEREHGEKKAAELRRASRQLLLTAPSHMMLMRDGKLAAVAVHAGIRDEYIGKKGAVIENFCRYGDVAGIGADGRPVRRDWTQGRTSALPIVWGHDPRPEPERKNGAINIDQGCVFGGALTALRFPEDELVSVPARDNYSGLSDTPLTRYRQAHG